MNASDIEVGGVYRCAVNSKVQTTRKVVAIQDDKVFYRSRGQAHNRGRVHAAPVPLDVFARSAQERVR